MRIAIFTDTFSPQINGVTKNLDLLLEYFDNHGIEFIVFAPDVGSVSENEYENKIVRINSFDFFLYPELKFSLPNYFKFKKILADFQVDLIHLVTPFNIGLTGLYYAKHNEIPFVASYHTNFDQYLEYYNIKFLEEAAWKYLKWFHNQALCNYCPSKDTLEQLERRGFENLDIWGRGINAGLFAPSYRDLDFRRQHNLEGKTAILYVGRLAKEKNISLLFDSFARLNRKYQDRIALIVTGDGPQASELKRNAPANIIFTGYKTRKELSKVYASADVFAFPSITETYGNVIIEAMSSGLPVVAIMAGGIKENLIDGYNGIACYNNDLTEFTEKLERIILDNKLQKELAGNARKYALKQNWDDVFKRLLSSYIKIISKNKSLSDISA